MRQRQGSGTSREHWFASRPTTDRCAVCAYYHLKQQALNGGRNRLSLEQLEYVGVVSRVRDVSGGWRQLTDSAWENDSLLAPEDVEILQSLMMIGSTERVEFLA